MTLVPLRRILYVEDEPDIRALSRFSLETLGGFEVCACASGEDALSELAHFRPDLLLLDVMLPRMDGPTLLAELRRLPVTRATPAIFVTASYQQAEIDAYLARGAIDVIVKPFDPMQLPARLHAIWKARHG